MSSAASPLPHDEFERRVLTRQLALVAAPARGAIVGTPLWALAVAWIMSGAFPVLGMAPLMPTLGWLGAIFAVCLGTLALDTAYRRAAALPAPIDPRAWLWAHASAFACLSALWASLVWVFWIDGNPSNQLTLAILVFCGIMNGIISRMNKFETFLIGSGLSVLVFWAKLFSETSDVANIFAVLLPVWFMAMSLHVRAASAQVRRNIEAQVENDVLNAALAKARDEAEAGRQAAERANQMKSSFLANMSHELRTPLNAILGFSEMIAVNGLGDAPERYRAYAHDIHGSGQHLLSLINDILDVAKI